jgi:hypothetical protein
VSAPEISVVLPTDTYATVRNVVSHLRRQSVSDRLELVLVTPEPERLELDDDVRADLHSVRLVASEIESMPLARARGIEAAAAPVVVLGETHAYPAPEYAEALLEAHRGPWAVVGPAMLNANPESLLAWAALYLDYGPWVDCKHRGPMDDVPAHNGAYKRDVLLEYGPRLEAMLESDTVLNADLRARGKELYLEPRAQTYHLNVSQLGTWLAERVVAGRAFAASRAAGWPRRRRLAYALGSPLIPLVRLVRIRGQIRASGRERELLPRLLPALVVALAFSAFGELLGYARGVGGAQRLLYEIELHRERYARRGR